MCWGLGRPPLSAPTRGELGRGGGESEAAEGPGPRGSVVRLKATPRHLLPILLFSPGEDPLDHGARPQQHRLQPDPAAAAARGQRPLQLPAAPARQARQQIQSGETRVPCVCARWVMSQ